MSGCICLDLLMFGEKINYLASSIVRNYKEPTSSEVKSEIMLAGFYRYNTVTKTS